MKRMSRELVGVCALMVASCSTMTSKPEAVAQPAPAAQPAAVPSPIVSGTLGEQAITVTAKVKKVDQKTRKVTLVGADGQPVTVTAGPEVKNLAQVKVGDDVSATYYQSIAYDVVKPGEATPGVAVAAGVERAKPGEKPAAAGARVTTITATITGIDKTNQTATLTMPDGEVVVVKARNPQNLEKVKKGDLAQITLTEALAIAVEPAKK